MPIGLEKLKKKPRECRAFGCSGGGGGNRKSPTTSSKFKHLPCFGFVRADSGVSARRSIISHISDMLQVLFLEFVNDFS